MFIDANVFLYAAGAPHPLKEGSQAIVAQLGTGHLNAVTSTEVLQELLHVLSGRGRAAEGAKLVRKVASLLPVLTVEAESVIAAGELLVAHAGIGARDAVHVATMRRAGITEIVSAYRGFDRVPGIVRRSPDAFAATAT